MALIVVLMALLAMPFKQGQSHTSLITAYLEKLPPVWLSPKSTPSSGPAFPKCLCSWGYCALLQLYIVCYKCLALLWMGGQMKIRSCPSLLWKCNLHIITLYTWGILRFIPAALWSWCSKYSYATPKSQEPQLLKGQNYICRACVVLRLLFDLVGVKLSSK